MNALLFVCGLLFCSAHAEDQDCSPSLANGFSACDEGGNLFDECSLGVSLLQLHATRLLNAAKASNPVPVPATNLTDVAGADWGQPEQALSNLTAEMIPGAAGLKQAMKVREVVQKIFRFVHEVTGTGNARSECGLSEGCKKETGLILSMIICLTLAIVFMIVAFCFFREDKEEQVTPLCPQMVVRDPVLTFKLALDPLAERLDVFQDIEPAKNIAKLALDWPDPFRPCASGIASTARLMNVAGMNMATVVARNCAVSGQALALCRHGCEIFGFVEPDTPTKYHVKHRTGVHLLTLEGDFSTWEVAGVNPAGAVVFSAKKEEGFVVGKVQQHVDAGLIICCVIAAEIHRVLQQPPPVGAPLPYSMGLGMPLDRRAIVSRSSETTDEATTSSTGPSAYPSVDIRQM